MIVEGVDMLAHLCPDGDAVFVQDARQDASKDSRESVMEYTFGPPTHT